MKVVFLSSVTRGQGRSQTLAKLAATDRAVTLTSGFTDAALHQALKDTPRLNTVLVDEATKQDVERLVRYTHDAIAVVAMVGYNTASYEPKPAIPELYAGFTAMLQQPVENPSELRNLLASLDFREYHGLEFQISDDGCLIHGIYKREEAQVVMCVHSQVDAQQFIVALEMATEAIDRDVLPVPSSIQPSSFTITSAMTKLTLAQFYKLSKGMPETIRV